MVCFKMKYYQNLNIFNNDKYANILENILNNFQKALLRFLFIIVLAVCLLLKHNTRGWRDGSALRSSCCSYKESHSVLRPSITSLRTTRTPVSGNLTPFSGLHGYARLCTITIQRHKHTYKYINKSQEDTVH